MTTLKRLITSEVSRQLVDLAADDGLTVAELRTKPVRDALQRRSGRRRISATQWSDAERGLDWETRHRSGVRTTCAGCGAPVLWVESVKNDKQTPVDPLPHPKGNLRLERVGAGILAHQIPKSAPRPERAYRPHFATCPTSGRPRRRGRGHVAVRPAQAITPAGGAFALSDQRCAGCGELLAQVLVDDGLTHHYLCGPSPPCDCPAAARRPHLVEAHVPRPSPKESTS